MKRIAALCLLILLFPFFTQPVRAGQNVAGSSSPSSAVATATFAGKVVSVSDGDTLSVLRDGRSVKIRLNGIDCPEQRQAWGTRARQFTSEAVFGKAVRVEVKDTDRYGRLVADVFYPSQAAKDAAPTLRVPEKNAGTLGPLTDNLVPLAKGELCLNRELVRAGLGWWYRRYAPHDTILAQLEAEARAAKRGLWSDSNPLPPWDFRRPSAAVPATSTGGTGRGMGVPMAEAAKPVATATESVYNTASGKKYHRAGCRYLNGGGTALPIKEATERGLAPCKLCRPYGRQ